jgi:hypothetical protein
MRNPVSRPHGSVRTLARALAGGLACTVATVAAAQERRNWFNDPFAQATSGLPGCPVPAGPLMTEAEMRRDSHYRLNRGTTCWLEKKCEEPNAYARDPQINQAVVAAITADRRFADTSVWVITLRKFVFLQGCVRARTQIAQLLELVRRVPRVEYAGDELIVGTRGKPPYRVAGQR